MRLIAISALVLSTYCSNGQTLSLDDIFSVKGMDSTALRAFAYEKGFELREIDVDAWRSVHKYYSMTDSSIWFERTFPTGTNPFFEDNTNNRDNRMVYYHFTGKEALNDFKQRMKEKKFKFKRSDRNDFGKYIFTHNTFVTKDNNIDLASEELQGQEIKYTLMYYARFK